MTNKFLDLAGLEILVNKIKSTITGAVSAAEITSVEYDNAGKISLAKGSGTDSVNVSIPLASALTGTQSGLLTKDDYTAFANKVEYIGTNVDGSVTVSVPLQKVGDFNNVAVIEILSSINAAENSKAVTGKAVADYVTEQINANASSDKEYIDSTVSDAVDELTKAYKAADTTLSEALTTAYTNAIASSATNIEAAYKAADADITTAYTQLVSETKEALQQEIDGDVNALKESLKKEDSEVAGQYVSAVSQSNGVINVSRANLPVYSLKKTDTAGYKYELTVDGVKTGDAIDIKDMVVSGGSVSTKEDGKTYLDLTIANGETVSIPADSLVDTYKAGEGEDRIVVNGYTISLNLANLTRDLVKNTTMLGKFATVDSLSNTNSSLTELTSKHNEFETSVAETYATKDAALGSLSELDFGGNIETNSYYASFTAKDVNGTVHSTIRFDLATKSEIESLF